MLANEASWSGGFPLSTRSAALCVTENPSHERVQVSAPPSQEQGSICIDEFDVIVFATADSMSRRSRLPVNKVRSRQ
jgi:hypothetical protein